MYYFVKIVKYTTRELHLKNFKFGQLVVSDQNPPPFVHHWLDQIVGTTYFQRINLFKLKNLNILQNVLLSVLTYNIINKVTEQNKLLSMFFPKGTISM